MWPDCVVVASPSLNQHLTKAVWTDLNTAYRMIPENDRIRELLGMVF
jgi:hypothetical protein